MFFSSLLVIIRFLAFVLIFHSRCWLLSCSRISLSQMFPLILPSRSLLIRSIFKLITQSARPIRHQTPRQVAWKITQLTFYFAFYPHIKSRPLCRTNYKLSSLGRRRMRFAFFPNKHVENSGKTQKTRREKQNRFYFPIFQCTLKQTNSSFTRLVSFLLPRSLSCHKKKPRLFLTGLDFPPHAKCLSTGKTRNCGKSQPYRAALRPGLNDCANCWPWERVPTKLLAVAEDQPIDKTDRRRPTCCRAVLVCVCVCVCIDGRLWQWKAFKG